MFKKLMTLGLGLSLIVGITVYYFVWRDEARLQRLGYSQQEISQLTELDNHLVRKLIGLNRRSENIFEFLDVPMFNYTLYDEYVRFSNEHPQLNTQEVIATVSFLNHIFVPTLIQAGYDEETIATWNQSEQFNSFMGSADLISLNNILSFAQKTGNELDMLYKYIDYEERSPHLEIEEVIGYVDFYKKTVIPNLTGRGFTEEEIDKVYQQISIHQFKYLLETQLGPFQTLELINASGFNPESFPIYEEILNENLEMGAAYAVQLAKHPNVIGNFYEDIVQTPNQNSLLALVNRNFRLSYNYRPMNFAQANVPISEFTNVNGDFLRKEAADATERLFASALEKGHELILRQGFVSFDTQQQLYAANSSEVNEYGIPKTPRAGHSEHQTGLAISITTLGMNEALTEEFAKTDAGRWVQENAHYFGFIIRYPEGREAQTGMPFQPYHLRYVGVEAATEIFENDWILEEFVLMHALLDLELEEEVSFIIEGENEEEEEETELSEEVSETDEFETEMDEVPIQEEQEDDEALLEPNEETSTLDENEEEVFEVPTTSIIQLNH